MDAETKILEIIADFKILLGKLRAGKPNDRSDRDRHSAIAITLLEQALAYFAFFVGMNGLDVKAEKESDDDENTQMGSCPRCGSSNVVILTRDTPPVAHCGFCNDCKYWGPEASIPSRALALWNAEKLK